MKLKKIISAIAASAMLYLSAVPGLAFTVGEDSGAGKVTEYEKNDIGHGIVYEDMTLEYTEDQEHKMKVLTFDPGKGEIIPLVYSKYMGYGATLPDSAASAEAAGYNVIAGTNASFFSLTASCNIYGGVCISDGIVATGNHTFPETEVIAFMPDGRAELVKSKLAYSFTFDRGDTPVVVECINICPDDTYDVIYYYDRFCGTKTDTKTLGIEVVFEKMYETELTVGGKLYGEVAEIRDGVNKGGEIGEDQFILYASETSEFAKLLRTFKKGDVITMKAEETLEESREIMENCASAFPTYGYVIVRDGENVTDSDGLGDYFNTRRGPRTALGIKENGEMVILSFLGREEKYPGVSVYEVADILISEGCVTGINLDGGGSVQLITENGEGKLEPRTPIQRRVANSLLLVEKKPNDAVKTKFDFALAMAKSYFVSYELGKGREELIAVIDEVSHLSDGRSTGAEYVKATAKLSLAMENTEKLKIFEGVYAAFENTVLLKSADDGSKVICEIPEGESFTFTHFEGDYGFTRYKGYYGWVPVENVMGLGSVEDVKLEINVPDILYKGEDLTVSWNVIPGVTDYSYKVTEYDSIPDGTAEGVILAEAWTVNVNKLKIPWVSRTDGRYITVEVSADFPLGSLKKTATVMTSALPFRDVPRDHWGYASAVHSFEKGYITGVTAETFAPDVTVSRAMMATLVYRMAGSPELSENSRHGFDDVEDGAWYEDGVTWCRENEIVSGISETRFAPDAPVTREQAACFLMRYAILLGKDTDVGEDSLKDSFSDAESVSAFANKAVRWAVENGIIKGSYGRLDPLGTADRIQLAAILANFDSAITTDMNNDKQ